MQKHHEETLPALPEDRIRRLNQLNYYFTILPKKTVGTIFTVCVAGADSLGIWEKGNSLARIDMHRKHPNKKIVRDAIPLLGKESRRKTFILTRFAYGRSGSGAASLTEKAMRIRLHMPARSVCR